MIRNIKYKIQGRSCLFARYDLPFLSSYILSYLDLPQYFSDGGSDTEFCSHFFCSGALIDYHQMFSVKIVDKACRRVYYQGCASNDQRIGAADSLYASPDGRSVQTLLIEYHIRLDDPAALASGNSPGFFYIGCVIEFSAFLAVIPVNAAVELISPFGFLHLMKSVQYSG